MIEYPIIILFSILGMVFLILSNDLISTFLALELQSLSLYILATSYAPSKEESTSAGLKYFILGSLSTGFILLGFSLIYGLTGVTDYESLSLILGASISMTRTMPFLLIEYNPVTWALIIMAIGLLFKISAAPFHNWAPDVYDEVPTIITMWLTIMPKISLIIFILQFYGGTLAFSSHNISNSLSTLFLITALLSMLLGTIVGLAQIKIKRLLAYSTISHIGFILLALSMVMTPSIDNLGTMNYNINNWNIIGCLVFYIIQYSLTNLILFYVLIIRQSLVSSSKNITSYISDIKYWLYNENKIEGANEEGTNLLKMANTKKSINLSLSITFLICIFSLAGIPPLIGFYGKQMILSIALTNGLVMPSIIAILTSVISAAYYLKLISTMYFSALSTSTEFTNTPASTITSDMTVNSIISFIISFILIIVIIGIMFFDPTLLLDMIIN